MEQVNLGQNFVKSIEEINWERTENLKETSIQYKCLLFNFYTNIEKTSSKIYYSSPTQRNKPFCCPSVRRFLSKTACIIILENVHIRVEKKVILTKIASLSFLWIPCESYFSFQTYLVSSASASQRLYKILQNLTVQSVLVFNKYWQGRNKVQLQSVVHFYKIALSC